jgi:hypothetical protein
MTPEEKKRQFEENIITLAVQEYYQYVDEKKLVRSEADSKMFYEVYRMGIFAGVNYATNKYMQSLKNFEENKNETEHKHQDKTK